MPTLAGYLYPWARLAIWYDEWTSPLIVSTGNRTLQSLRIAALLIFSCSVALGAGLQEKKKAANAADSTLDTLLKARQQAQKQLPTPLSSSKQPLGAGAGSTSSPSGAWYQTKKADTGEAWFAVHPVETLTDNKKKKVKRAAMMQVHMSKRSKSKHGSKGMLSAGLDQQNGEDDATAENSRPLSPREFRARAKMSQPDFLTHKKATWYEAYTLKHRLGLTSSSASSLESTLIEALGQNGAIENTDSMRAIMRKYLNPGGSSMYAGKLEALRRSGMSQGASSAAFGRSSASAYSTRPSPYSSKSRLSSKGGYSSQSRSN